MKLNIKFTRLVKMLPIFLVLAGCDLTGSLPGTGDENPKTGGEKTVYETKIVPSQYSVTIPRSLTAAAVRQGGSVRSGGTSFGFDYLKSGVALLKNYTSGFEQNLLFMDVVLTAKSSELADGVEVSVAAGEIMITITEEMVNKWLESYEQWAPADEDVRAAFQEFVGTEVPCPKMKITKFTTPADGYHWVVVTETQDTSGSSGGDVSDLSVESPEVTATMTMKWNTAQTRLFTNDILISRSETYSSETINRMVYDATGERVKSSLEYSMKMSNPQWGNSVSSTLLSAEETGTKNGIFVEFKTSYEAENIKYVYQVKGLADDDGGYVESAVTDRDITQLYKETFDGQGVLTSVLWSEDNGETWKTFEGFGEFDAGDYDDTYNEDYADYSAHTAYSLVYSGDAQSLIITSASVSDSISVPDEDFWSKMIGNAAKDSEGNWDVYIWDEALLGEAKVFSWEYDDQWNMVLKKEDVTIVKVE